MSPAVGGGRGAGRRCGSSSGRTYTRTARPSCRTRTMSCCATASCRLMAALAAAQTASTGCSTWSACRCVGPAPSAARAACWHAASAWYCCRTAAAGSATWQGSSSLFAACAAGLLPLRRALQQPAVLQAPVRAPGEGGSRRSLPHVDACIAPACVPSEECVLSIAQRGGVW
jgi:hypothetical protein